MVVAMEVVVEVGKVVGVVMVVLVDMEEVEVKGVVVEVVTLVA